MLLFLMTGSVVIPVKALVMNVLSLGAALGVTVWIFEDGHLEDLLRFTSAGAVENTIPLLVLAFGFGLSMDYEVFLLSRIVELHEQGHDTREAVTLGLQRSGRIITSAALLMVIVFAGFAAGDLLVMKEMGIGPGARDRHRRDAGADAAGARHDVGARLGTGGRPARCAGCTSGGASPSERRVRLLDSAAELVDATGGHPVAVLDVGAGFVAPAYAVGSPPTAPSSSTAAPTTGCRGRRPSARHPAWRPCSTTRPCAPGSPAAATGTSACRAG